MRQTIYSLACFILFCSTHSYADSFRVGLRAHTGTQIGLQQWQATTDYLSTKITNHNFTLVPYEKLPDLMDAAGKNEFDFVITNPSSYMEMHLRYGAESLVTMINNRNNTAQSRFGSVIFTHADNTGIINVKDLRGKKLMAVSETAFGGWRVAWLELKQQGFNPYAELGELSWGEGNQHNVVYAVRDKKVDAGVVRTDMLERMASAGLIDLRYFRIINAKETRDFPFFHSTPLYPEWSFAAFPHINADTRQQVKTALQNISRSDPAAIKGKYIGWFPSLNYQPVAALMRQLEVGPYKKTNHAIPVNILWIILSIAVLFILTLFAIKYRAQAK